MSLALICQNRRCPRNPQAGGYGKTWLDLIYVAGAFAFTNNWFQAGNKTHPPVAQIPPKKVPRHACCTDQPLRDERRRGYRNQSKRFTELCDAAYVAVAVGLALL
jgi:hypothetical protein